MNCEINKSTKELCYNQCDRCKNSEISFKSFFKWLFSWI